MPNARQPDTVHIEGDLGRFDKFTTLQVTNDYLQPAEASFEAGDDTSWRTLEKAVKLGTKYKVFVNDCLHLTGRVEMFDVPMDTSSGVSVRFAVRTKLADAMYASADPKTRYKDVRVFEFIEALYAPLGITPDNFIWFSEDMARDLMTGKVSKPGPKNYPYTDPDEMSEDQAKVNPPESIYQAADKHLRRFGLMHWDSPDGKICIGAPNDNVPPIYQLKIFRGPNGIANNVLSATRSRDAAGVPSTLGIFGTASKDEWTKAKVRSVRTLDEISGAGFYRPVLILAEAAKTQELAERMAKRELSGRLLKYDTWSAKVDGLSFWSGNGIRIPWSIDTVVEVMSDVVGSLNGSYLITHVNKMRSPKDGDTADLTLLRKGLWVL